MQNEELRMQNARQLHADPTARGALFFTLNS